MGFKLWEIEQLEFAVERLRELRAIQESGRAPGSHWNEAELLQAVEAYHRFPIWPWWRPGALPTDRDTLAAAATALEFYFTAAICRLWAVQAGALEVPDDELAELVEINAALTAFVPPWW